MRIKVLNVYDKENVNFNYKVLETDEQLTILMIWTLGICWNILVHKELEITHDIYVSQIPQIYKT